MLWRVFVREVPVPLDKVKKWPNGKRSQEVQGWPVWSCFEQCLAACRWNLHLPLSLCSATRKVKKDKSNPEEKVKKGTKRANKFSQNELGHAQSTFLYCCDVLDHHSMLQHLQTKQTEQVKRGSTRGHAIPGHFGSTCAPFLAPSFLFSQAQEISFRISPVSISRTASRSRKNSPKTGCLTTFADSLRFGI